MATFHAGVGGKAKLGAAGADINITTWEFTKTSRLAETTHSGSGGVATWQHTVGEARGQFEFAWDSTQIPDSSGFNAGGTITDLRLFCGDSSKFYSFPAIVEELHVMVNVQNDIVRARCSFRSNGAITAPV